MLLRRTMLSAVVLTIAFLPLAIAQPPTRNTPSWLLSAQVYLGDEGLQKELKLSDEQSKKATELAKAAGSRVTARGRADDKEREKIDQEIKKDLEGFLEKEQMARLREVILQNMASRTLAGAALLEDPEVAKRLKFTQEQTKKIQAREKFEDVLTGEQKKEWAKLVGKPYTAPLRVSYLPPFGRPSLPDTLQYLAADSVSKDLKLSDKQKEQVVTLTKKYEKALSDADATKGQQLRADGEKEARAVLSESQVKRLDQIDLQLSTRGRDEALLKNARVVKTLKVTDEQQKKIDSTLEARRKEMLALFTADEDAKKILDNVQEFKTQTRKKLTDVLDKDQQAALKELVGDPFEGEAPRIRRTGGGGGFPSATSTLYVYGTGAAFLGSPDLHKELKVDEAGAKKLTAIAEKTYQSSITIVGDDKARKEHADANKKEVGAILDAKQMKRFEGIYLGFVADRGARTSSIQRYAEVQEALKLTDDQKTKLRSSEPIDKVLDGAQAKVWKQLRGEPFAGQLVLPERRGSPRTSTTALYLYDTGAAFLGSPDLHKELKVDEAAAKKLTALAEKTYQRRTSVDDDDKVRKQRAEANRKELAGLLDEKQTKRFEEVYWQRVGTAKDRRISTAHRYDEVRQALKLTDKQKQGPSPRSEPFAKLLDKTQAKTWKKMCGEPFQGELVLPDSARRGRIGEPLVISALRSPAVDKELALTDKQRKKVDEADKAYQEKTTRTGGEGFEERQKRQAAARTELEQAVKQFLDEKQHARLQQILLQEAKKSGFRMLLEETAVKEGLKIDEDQQKKVGSINENTERLADLLLTEYGGFRRGGDRPDTGYEKALAAINKNAEKRREALLTAKQQKQLEALLGKPFEGEIQRPRGTFER